MSVILDERYTDICLRCDGCLKECFFCYLMFSFKGELRRGYYEG